MSKQAEHPSFTADMKSIVATLGDTWNTLTLEPPALLRPTCRRAVEPPEHLILKKEKQTENSASYRPISVLNVDLKIRPRMFATHPEEIMEKGQHCLSVLH